MLRALDIILPHAGRHSSRRRRHQFAPSIGGTASQLEDRALLSAVGGSAHAAVAAHHHAAHHQAAHHHRAVHHHRAAGMPHAQETTRAAIANDPIVMLSATGGATVLGLGNGTTGTSTVGTVNPSSTVGTVNPSSTVGTVSASSAFGPFGVSASLPAGLTNSIVGMNAPTQPQGVVISGVGTPSIAASVRQVPMGFNVTGPTGNGTPTSTTTSSTTTTGATGTTSTTQTISVPTSITDGISGISGISGTTVTSAISPLDALLLNGTIPTPGATNGQTTVATLTFTPTTTTDSPINASPLPLNGTLPFTGTPANPSPLPLNGTLPFTGTPANPSPVGSINIPI